MNKCNECQEKLSLYIDNYLSDEEINQLEQHLDECPECRKELNQLQETTMLFKKLKDEELYPPIEMRKQIREKLERKSPVMLLLDNLKRKPWKMLMPLASAALIMIIVLSYSLSGSDFNNQDKQQFVYENGENKENNLQENKKGNQGESQNEKNGKPVANENIEENNKLEANKKLENKTTPMDFLKNKLNSLQNTISKQIAINDKNKKLNKQELNVPEKDVEPTNEQSRERTAAFNTPEETKDVKIALEQPAAAPQSVALQRNMFARNLDFMPRLQSEVEGSKNDDAPANKPEKDFVQKIEVLVNELDGEITKQNIYIYDSKNQLKASNLTLNIAENNFNETYRRLKELGSVRTNSKINVDKQVKINKIKEEIKELELKEKSLEESDEIKEESRADEELSKIKQQIKLLERDLKNTNNSKPTVIVDLEIKEKN